ncbi:hypothetical protein vseg_000453 [Gypsophila vaccaria]
MATTTEGGVLMHGESIHEELELELENGCGCFHSLWSSRGKRHITGDDDQWNLLSERQRKPSWLVTQLNKLKEASEQVAGPKWKNLIRKMGAYFNNGRRKKNLQYDSFNYTLNFDDGVHDTDEDGAVLGFSSRFAPPVNDKPRPTM